MKIMSKRKPPSSQSDPQPDSSGDGVTPISLRIIDPRLLAAADRCAEHDRRSRNLMLNILLEEALTARGYWPPPSQ